MVGKQVAHPTHLTFRWCPKKYAGLIIVDRKQYWLEILQSVPPPRWRGKARMGVVGGLNSHPHPNPPPPAGEGTAAQHTLLEQHQIIVSTITHLPKTHP